MSNYKVVPVEASEAIHDAVDLLCDDHAAFDDSDAFWHYLLSASPDTGMVAVPRELLERIVNTNMADYSVIVYQHKEIRTILEKAND